MVAARKRILVIDDDAAVRQSCERVLSERGYEVETAASGTDGLARSRRGGFDCALVDLRMPDIDGMEIIRDARQNHNQMPLLILTGYGEVHSAAEAIRLGVADYICKPFSPEEIVQSVSRALERVPETVTVREFVRIAEDIKNSAAKPEHYEHRSPQSVAEMVTKAVGVKKATMSLVNMLILGILAGAYIGFGGALATVVGQDAAKTVGVGIAQLLAGSAFSVGLILVVIAGAELFTGNNLMITSVLEGQYGLGRMLSRWGAVYAANFIGALLLVVIMYYSGLWKMASNGVGVKALSIASAKVSLPFGEAFFRGIGCNWLVCLAVWMALSAREIAGKVLVIFFPIMAFVALGYEHCVANMYFIPMGLLLKGTAAATGFAGDLNSLTWGRFLTANLIPVTLGNVVGGALFVGSAYWCAFMMGGKKKA